MEIWKNILSFPNNLPLSYLRMDECINAEYLQDPDYNAEQEFKLQNWKMLIQWKQENVAFLIDLVNFVISTSMLPLKHGFSWLFPQIIEIHDLFMTIQVSDSDSGLFRFIHDCGHPCIQLIPKIQSCRWSKSEYLSHLVKVSSKYLFDVRCMVKWAAGHSVALQHGHYCIKLQNFLKIWAAVILASIGVSR